MRCIEIGAWAERIHIELRRFVYAAETLQNPKLDMHLAAARSAILSAQATLSQIQATERREAQRQASILHLVIDNQ